MNTQSSQQGTLLRKICFGVVLALAVPLAYAGGTFPSNIPVNCTGSTPDDLHLKISSANPGDILLISGTCFANVGTNAGSFTIDKPLTLKQDPNSTVPAILDGGKAFPVLIVTANAPGTILQGLTIQNGISTSTLAGGITNSAPAGKVGPGLSILNSTIQNNTFLKGAANGVGVGGVYNNFGNMYISQSNFLSNSTFNTPGGGLNNNNGDITISGSTFANNATSYNSVPGGGIYNDVRSAGSMTITASTFYNNSAYITGAGLFSLGNLTVSQSTISGNHSGTPVGGAGIYNTAGTLTISQSIIVNNISNFNNTETEADIFTDTANGGTNNIDTYSKISVINNGGTLINGPTVSFVAVTNPINNTTSTLADWGGPTMTMKPDATQTGGNPAINIVLPADCTAISNTDQRGATKPGVGKAQCDVGAYETGSPQISVTPSNKLLDFTTVTSGNSSKMMVEVQNIGNDELVLSSANISPLPSNFVVLSPPTFPVSVVFQKVQDFNVEYTPTAAVTDMGILGIGSNDPAINTLNHTLNINLTGTGSGVFTPQPIQQIQDILNLLKTDYPTNLFGMSSGKSAANSAANRFNAFQNMMLSASSEINNGDYADACSQLKDAAGKIDVPQNTSKNSNFFVGGVDAATLYADITALITTLNCSS